MDIVRIGSPTARGLEAFISLASAALSGSYSTSDLTHTLYTRRLQLQCLARTEWECSGSANSPQPTILMTLVLDGVTVHCTGLRLFFVIKEKVTGTSIHIYLFFMLYILESYTLPTQAKHALFGTMKQVAYQRQRTSRFKT